jgi:uncharacterized FlgJ-related protein
MPYFLLIVTLLFFSSCSDEEYKGRVEISISSVNDLEKVFNDFNYTSESWDAGNKEVPRIHLSKISSTWKETSNKIPVKKKKEIFFRLLMPLVLLSNEEISIERKRLLLEGYDSLWTKKLALKYKVIKTADTSFSKAQFKELLKRVDIIPVSLALAQSAEESGWGTSRFASKGNALFGQWDFSGNGMIPAQQRKELGNYGLARFDSPLDSVKGYMLNLNTSYAYEKLRTLRQDIRKKNKKVTGWELAKTLDKYSEKGEAYIQGLHKMMRYNKLQDKDDTYLAQGPEIYIKRKE